MPFVPPRTSRPAAGHVISAVFAQRHLTIELTGFWDGDAATRYLVDLQRATTEMVRRGRYRGALVDASGYGIQPASVRLGHARAMRVAKDRFGARAAMVLPAAGSKLQILRLVEETGHRAFATHGEALDWLLS